MGPQKNDKPGSKKIGEVLVEEGLLSDQDLRLALKAQLVFGGKLGTILMEQGLATEEQLLDVLRRRMKVACADPGMFDSIEEDVIRLVAPEVASRHRAVPLSLDRKRLRVAMENPADLLAVDEISFLTGFSIEPLLALEARITRALERYYGMKPPLRYLRMPPASRAEEASLKAKGAWAAPAYQEYGERFQDLALSDQPLPEPTEEDMPKGIVIEPVAESVQDPTIRPTPARAPRSAPATPSPRGGAFPPTPATSRLAAAPTPLARPGAAPPQPSPTRVRPQSPAGAPPRTPATPLAGSHYLDAMLNDLSLSREARVQVAESLGGLISEEEKKRDLPLEVEPRVSRPVAPMAIALRLSRVETREEIGDALIEYFGPLFRRVALFILQKERVLGWKCIGLDHREGRLRTLWIPSNLPSIFDSLRTSRSYFLGELPDTAGNTALVRAIGGGRPPVSLLLPVLFGDTVVASVYCDNGGAPMGKVDLRACRKVVRKAGLAMEMLLLKGKIRTDEG